MRLFDPRLIYVCIHLYLSQSLPPDLSCARTLSLCVSLSIHTLTNTRTDIYVYTHWCAHACLSLSLSRTLCLSCTNTEFCLNSLRQWTRGCTQTHTHMHARTHTCTHAHTHTNTHAHTHIHTHTRMHTHSRSHVHMHTSTHSHVTHRWIHNSVRTVYRQSPRRCLLMPVFCIAPTFCHNTHTHARKHTHVLTRARLSLSSSLSPTRQQIHNSA